jgi:hypothetical protein
MTCDVDPVRIQIFKPCYRTSALLFGKFPDVTIPKDYDA